MNNLVLSLFPGRVCPKCRGKKAYYANSCRTCAPKNAPLAGRKGPDHPAWKGGQEIDRDGYIRTYAPDHPWPRRNGYVREHVRLMELSIGRQILPDEIVHHKDLDRRNNALNNLELISRGVHSSLHRNLDSHKRSRDERGRFV